MNLSTLSAFLEPTPQYKQLSETLRKSSVSATVQAMPDAAPFLLTTLWRDLDVPTLIIAPKPEEARRLHENLVAWSGDDNSVLHFPETETLPFERVVTEIDTAQ